MTPAEYQEFLDCRNRMAELLYQEACEQGQTLSTLAEIEITVREQIQTYVAPGIGEFFAKPSVELKKATPEP